MTKDLRTFLRQLDEAEDNTFVHVKTQVDPKYGLSAVLRRLDADGVPPVVYFESVAGSAIPVLSNLFANPKALALALDTERHRLGEEFANRCQTPIKPQSVETGPVKQVIYRGDEADLTTLPQIVHSVGDAGVYITAAVAITRDPDSGVYNAGIYRLQIVGPRKMRINPGPGSDLRRIVLRNEELGQPTPTAICIGHHPALHFASQSRTPPQLSELDFTGGLLGEPLRMVPAETLNLEVLADSEIVIEAQILSGTREDEGPFIELGQYKNPGEYNPVVEVTAMTMRNDPIFHDIYSAHADHNNAGAAAREAELLLRARSVCPAVTTVHLPAPGATRFTAYVALDEPTPGMARNVALQLLSTHPALKQVVLVNTDIDIYYEPDVQWAIASRVRADEDIIVMPGFFSSGLDPAGHSIHSRTERGSVNAKWIIDATAQPGSHQADRRDLPREMWQQLDLSKYLGNSSELTRVW
ncbi:MAG: UbiD family decarboxylase [Propionibacteriaceae bacterium]|nr:UbiD family decarboxylase [Propionibacteriaceae bacterium]